MILTPPTKEPEQPIAPTRSSRRGKKEVELPIEKQDEVVLTKKTSAGRGKELNKSTIHTDAPMTKVGGTKKEKHCYASYLPDVSFNTALLLATYSIDVSYQRQASPACSLGWSTSATKTSCCYFTNAVRCRSRRDAMDESKSKAYLARREKSEISVLVKSEETASVTSVHQPSMLDRARFSFAFLSNILYSLDVRVRRVPHRVRVYVFLSTYSDVF